MPIFIEILVAFLLFTLVYFFMLTRRKAKQEMEQKEAVQQQKLQQQFDAIQDRINAFEKRLSNMELIVTDTQFIDPPTNGREAIDLKSEISELKNIIKNLNK